MFSFSLPCLFPKRSHTCTYNPCTVGGYDLRCLQFTNADICECEIRNAEKLISQGFDEYRLDPVSVAAKFLNSSAVPCSFRGKPAYLKCKKTVSQKTYVVLGVSCVGDAVIELVCREASCGKKFYTVCRVAYICA